MTNRWWRWEVDPILIMSIMDWTCNFFSFVLLKSIHVWNFQPYCTPFYLNQLHTFCLFLPIIICSSFHSHMLFWSVFLQLDHWSSMMIKGFSTHFIVDQTHPHNVLFIISHWLININIWKCFSFVCRKFQTSFSLINDIDMCVESEFFSFVYQLFFIIVI